MRRLHSFRTRGSALATLLAACLSGCGGKTSRSTGPTGDATGEHLLVYTSDAGRPAGEHGLALYDFDLNGFHGLPGLDAAGSEFDPCLSNDGRFLAFSATRGSTGSDIIIYDRLLAALQGRPKLATAAEESWPRFAYDSIHLAFVRRLATGAKRVLLYEPAGDTLVPLPGLAATDSTRNDDEPAPNLDGSRIAFMSDRGGTHDILLWRRAPVVTIPALASTGDDIEPSLTADGRWLAFASDRAGGAGGYDIYLYDVTNGVLITLPGLNSAGNDRHPSVSADGDVIAFQSDRAGGGGLNDLYFYTVSTQAITQPAPLKAPSDDISPYLRWR